MVLLLLRHSELIEKALADVASMAKKRNALVQKLLLEAVGDCGDVGSRIGRTDRS